MKEWRNIASNRALFSSMLAKSKTVIVFDTETTSLGSDAKIIEFAAIRYLMTPKGFIEDAKMDIFINPLEPLSSKIVELTGITDEILMGARTESEEADVIFDFLASGDLWAAYNCAFDLRMLRQMSQRLNYLYTENDCMDVLEMARDFIPKSDIENHKLISVTSYLFPKESGSFQFHSAIDDVRATARCMMSFLSMYKKFVPDVSGKHQCHVNWASFCVNPNARSQKRIKLNLVEGEYGDIFFDCVKKVWSCKTTTSAKRLFQSLDMENIEQQVLNLYGPKYGAWDICTLAYNMEQYQKNKRKHA